MSQNATLLQCATFVLEAFSSRQAGSEEMSKNVVNYFFRNNIPPAQCVIGIRHAVAMGWIQLVPDNRIKLLEAGVAFLKDQIDLGTARNLLWLHPRGI